MIDYAVEGKGLRVVRSGTEVLRGLNFDVPARRITGLLGPSGCGKSTLIRSIVGTQLVDAGRVTVLGRPAGDPRLRTRVAYASQQASVYPDLTVVENLRYFRVALRAPAADVDRVLSQVDLLPFADRLTARLSGGQRSRVSLAVALLGSPELLVLDEPTVGLDPVLRNSLWALFGQLAAGGMSLIVSSHVMDEADRCDELLLMRDGALLAQDTPSALKARTHADDLDLELAFLRLVSEQEVAA